MIGTAGETIMAKKAKKKAKKS